MQTGNFRKTLCLGLLVVASVAIAAGQKISRADSATTISNKTMLRILRVVDERRWDRNLIFLLSDRYPIIRKRAALALGRIGDEKALRIIESCFPGRKVTGIDSTEIIWGLGSFHCLSQQEPAV